METGAMSYVSGTSSVPLLGDTIGQHLDRVVARAGPTARRWSPASRASAGPGVNSRRGSTPSPPACSRSA